MQNPTFFSKLVKNLSGGGIVGNKLLYKKVGINQKRWSMLMNGQISPTIDEIGRVALFFGKSGKVTTGLSLQFFDDNDTLSIMI